MNGNINIGSMNDQCAHNPYAAARNGAMDSLDINRNAMVIQRRMQ